MTLHRQPLRVRSGMILLAAALGAVPAGVGDPPNAVEPAPTDAFGDPLPAHARARLGTMRWRQQWSYGALAHAADGKLLGLGWSEQGTGLWDVAAGKLLRQFPAEKPSGWLQPPLLSGDGRTVVASGDQNLLIQLFDRETGKERVRLKMPDRISRLAVSPDGKHLATAHWVNQGQDHLVRLWEAATGAELHQFKRTGPALAFAADGKTLLTGNDKRVRVWDVASGQEVRRFEGAATLMALSGDGRTLAGRGEGVIRLWDMTTGEEKCTIATPDDRVDTRFDKLALSADGRTVALAGNGYLLAWDTATGKDRFRRIGDIGIQMVGLSPDGQTLLWGRHPTVHRWDLAAGREVLASAGHEDGVQSLSFFLDGATLLTADSAGTVRQWKLKDGRQVGDPAVSPAQGTRLACSPDGKLLAVTAKDRTIRLHDPATDQEVRALTGGADCFCLTFSPDGTILAAGDSYYGRSSNPHGRVHFWDVASGRLLRTIADHASPVRSLAFAPDGKTLASASDAIRLWDVANGKQVRRFAGPASFLDGLAFTPDGKTLISGGGAIVLWDVAVGEPRLRLAGNNVHVSALALAPDGKVLATAGRDHVVRLWDLLTGAELIALAGHAGAIPALAFSPDGKTLASGSEDTTLLLWDVPAAVQIARVKRQPEPIDLALLWENLARPDAAAAHKAVWALAAEPERAVAFIKERLKPPEKSDAADPDPQAIQVPAGEPLRAVRAIQVLEQIGTPGARHVLETLGKSNWPRISREAYAALDRLEQLREQPAAPAPIPAEPLEQLWKDLGEADAAAGHKAVWALVAEPEKAIALIKTRLNPAAVPAVNDPVLLVPAGNALRAVRAIEVLEQIGSPAARQVLETLSKGDSGRVTREAKAALERLDQRSGDKP